MVLLMEAAPLYCRINSLLFLVVWLQETGAGFSARVLPNENAATFSSRLVFSVPSCL